MDDTVISLNEVSSELILSGQLVYLESEYGFKFEVDAPMDLQVLAGDQGIGSLSLGTLQIAVGVETGNLLYPWGYHPHVSWLEAKLQPPVGRRCLLQVVSNSTRPLASGVAEKVLAAGKWISECDKDAGWLRVADDVNTESLEFVEFASGCIAGVARGQLNELWFHFEWRP